MTLNTIVFRDIQCHLVLEILSINFDIWPPKHLQAWQLSQRVIGTTCYLWLEDYKVMLKHLLYHQNNLNLNQKFNIKFLIEAMFSY